MGKGRGAGKGIVRTKSVCGGCAAGLTGRNDGRADAFVAARGLGRMAGGRGFVNTRTLSTWS